MKMFFHTYKQKKILRGVEHELPVYIALDKDDVQIIFVFIFLGKKSLSTLNIYFHGAISKHINNITAEKELTLH